MKKSTISILLIMALILSPAVNSSTFSLGGKGGAGITEARSPSGFGPSFDGTPYVGVVSELKTKSNLRLQLEIMYVEKGKKGFSSNLSYLEFPLTMKAASPSSVQPHLFFGLAPAFFIGERPYLLPVEIKIGTFDIGIVFGGGIDFKAGRNSILFDIRYVRGLKDVVGEQNWHMSATLGLLIPVAEI